MCDLIVIVLGVTQGGAQGFLLAQCSDINPGGAQS